MKKVLVAGATGYLGRFVAQAYKDAGYWVRILVRSREKAADLVEKVDEVFVGQATDPNTLKGVCRDIDLVFSSLGVTRQRDGLGYWDVDYLANHNLLQQAGKHKVGKFVFVSVLNPQKLRHLDMVAAREMFISELRLTGMDYTVLRPTGFFSDVAEFFKMAAKGRVYLLGDGQARMNPIHGADLAKVCVQNSTAGCKVVDVGGPEIYTYEKIARLALKKAGRPAKIIRLPRWLPRLLAGFVGVFSNRAFNLVSFMSIVMQNDYVGPKAGEHSLTDFFDELSSGKEAADATLSLAGGVTIKDGSAMSSVVSGLNPESRSGSRAVIN